MFLIIESGRQVEVCRRLAPNELLDCAHHAARYGRAIGYPIDTDSPGPTGLGADVDVTIQPTKKPGAAHVWNSAGFYFAERADSA
jgi:hypothetical protein